MSNELQTVQPLRSTGLERVRPAPGNLVLVQNTTVNKMGARVGQLLDTATGAAYDQLPVIALAVIHHRVLFGSSKLGEDPVCRSDNGLVPDPKIENPKSFHCVDPNTFRALCPYASWSNGRPPCKQKANLLLVARETGLPYYLTLGGTSLDPLWRMLRYINNDIKMQSNLGLDLYDYSFTIGGDNKGQYAVATFSDVKRIRTRPQAVLERIKDIPENCLATASNAG